MMLRWFVRAGDHCWRWCYPAHPQVFDQQVRSPINDDLLCLLFGRACLVPYCRLMLFEAVQFAGPQRRKVRCRLPLYLKYMKMLVTRQFVFRPRLMCTNILLCTMAKMKFAKRICLICMMHPAGLHNVVYVPHAPCSCKHRELPVTLF